MSLKYDSQYRRILLRLNELEQMVTQPKIYKIKTIYIIKGFRGYFVVVYNNTSGIMRLQRRNVSFLYDDIS